MTDIPQIDDVRLVFDAREWGGRDVGDNEQFWHPATIVEVALEPERGPGVAHYQGGGIVRDHIATVRFAHDGRLSHGHFVSFMRRCTS